MPSDTVSSSSVTRYIRILFLHAVDGEEENNDEGSLEDVALGPSDIDGISVGIIEDNKLGSSDGM